MIYLYPCRNATPVHGVVSAVGHVGAYGGISRYCGGSTRKVGLIVVYTPIDFYYEF